jgi:hypothetical protein
MDDTQKKRLAKFKSLNKPDSLAYLSCYIDEIVDLHYSGYTFKTIHKYLLEHGVTCTYATFIKWAKLNIDFEKHREAGNKLVDPISADNKATTSSARADEIIEFETDKNLPIQESSSHEKSNIDEKTKSQIAKETMHEMIEESKREMEKGFGKTPEQLIREVNKPR